MQVWGACPVRTWRGKANTVLECRRPTFRSALFCVVRGCLAVLDPRPAQGDCQPPWLLGPSLLGSPAGRCTCRGEGTLGQTSLEADKPSAPGVAPPTAASPARSLSVGPGGCVFKCHAPPTDHGIWSHFFNKELSTPGLACGDPEVGRGNSRLLGADCAPGSLAVSRQLLTYEQYRCWAGRGPRAGCTWSFGGQGRGVPLEGGRGRGEGSPGRWGATHPGPQHGSVCSKAVAFAFEVGPWAQQEASLLRWAWLLLWARICSLRSG